MQTDFELHVRRGDSTDFMDGEVTFVLDAGGRDLTGYTARFQAAGIVQDFTDIKGLRLKVVISKTDAERLPEGEVPAALKIFDKDAKAQTVCIGKLIVSGQIVSNEGK